MKIGQYLPKLWAIKYWVFFMKHGVEETVLYSVNDYYTVQPVTPSLPTSGSERREVTTEAIIHTTVV